MTISSSSAGSAGSVRNSRAPARMARRISALSRLRLAGRRTASRVEAASALAISSMAWCGSWSRATIAEVGDDLADPPAAPGSSSRTSATQSEPIVPRSRLQGVPRLLVRIDQDDPDQVLHGHDSIAPCWRCASTAGGPATSADPDPGGHRRDRSSRGPRCLRTVPPRAFRGPAAAPAGLVEGRPRPGPPLGREALGLAPGRRASSFTDASSTADLGHVVEPAIDRDVDAASARRGGAAPAAGAAARPASSPARP